MIKLYNTLNGKKEILSKKQTVKLFVCGPTVYDYPHIGHARIYLVFDSLVKFLKSQKFKVFYLQNITDIDDKIISRARKEKKNPLELSVYFSRQYLKLMQKLEIDSVNLYAYASRHIREIVAQIQILIQKGYAYRIEGSGYYFDISKFKDYGKLSGRTYTQAEDAVSRIDEGINKKNKGDFCLWKFSNSTTKENSKFTIINGEPLWNTPLGWGRPGWHIEDTAIGFKYLGPRYEIHGGGMDLKFPHHEAEIAQAEAISDEKPFVKIWMHVGLLNLNGKKMSKSLNNFISIEEFLNKYPPQVLRLIVLACHYRTPLDYSEKLAESYKESWRKIVEFLIKLNFIRKQNKKVRGAMKKNDPSSFISKFKNALSDDFKTPQALAELFSFINSLQAKIWHLSPKSIEASHSALKSSLMSLGINLPKVKIPPKIESLLKEREKYRRNKQFTHADDLRKKISQLGYEIEDTPIGPFTLPKEYGKS